MNLEPKSSKLSIKIPLNDGQTTEVMHPCTIVGDFALFLNKNINLSEAEDSYLPYFIPRKNWLLPFLPTIRGFKAIRVSELEHLIEWAKQMQLHDQLKPYWDRLKEFPNQGIRPIEREHMAVISGMISKEILKKPKPIKVDIYVNDFLFLGM